MIEDDELRAIFKAECEEHLQTLEQGLLQLEQNPMQEDALEEVFRAAHSLKGAARMLGLSQIGRLMHNFETVLGDAKRNTIILTSETIDNLYVALDTVRALVNEAVTGQSAQANVTDVVDLLEGRKAEDDFKTAVSDHTIADETPAPTPASLPSDSSSKLSQENPPTPSAATEKELDSSPPASAPVPVPAPTPRLPIQGRIAARARETAVSPSILHTTAPKPTDEQTSYKLDTIRVEAQQLDQLMTQVGELAVTKLHILRQHSEVEHLQQLWHNWKRHIIQFKLQKQPHPSLTRFIQETETYLAQIGQHLTNLRDSLYNNSTRLEMVTNELESSVQAIRLMPLSTIFNLFPRMVRDLARQTEKEIQLLIEGGDTKVDKHILEEIKDPLTHILRNAVDHGIEPPHERTQAGKSPQGTIWLKAFQHGTKVIIEVTDDGKGIDVDVIKRIAFQRNLFTLDELEAMPPEKIQSLIFMPGFSTSTMITDISGRGVGMDVVQTNVQKLKGTLAVNSVVGQGTTIRIELPVSVATTQVLIVSVNGLPYALPVDFINMTRLFKQEEIFLMEGRETVMNNGRPVPLARLADLLELPQTSQNGNHKNKHVTPTHFTCVICDVEDTIFGLIVDELLDVQEIVLKKHGPLLQRIRNVLGATILGTGEVCIVLNPYDLRQTATTSKHQPTIQQQTTKPPQKIRVLLAEDSITTRTQEKRILEAAGFEVITAVDGLDAFNKLNSQHFDIVVSDIEMPNMDGLTLTEKIRKEHHLKDLPVILVTSLAKEEDKKKGIEVGANAYITKSAFDQQILIDTIRRLV